MTAIRKVLFFLFIISVSSLNSIENLSIMGGRGANIPISAKFNHKSNLEITNSISQIFSFRLEGQLTKKYGIYLEFFHNESDLQKDEFFAEEQNLSAKSYSLGLYRKYIFNQRLSFRSRFSLGWTQNNTALQEVYYFNENDDIYRSKRFDYENIQNLITGLGCDLKYDLALISIQFGLSHYYQRSNVKPNYLETNKLTNQIEYFSENQTHNIHMITLGFNHVYTFPLSKQNYVQRL